MLIDSLKFFITAVSLNFRAHSIFESNKSFCESKGITIEDIKNDISEYYLYPTQNKACHSQHRIKYILGETGNFEIFFHPDDIIVQPSIDSNFL